MCSSYSIARLIRKLIFFSWRTEIVNMYLDDSAGKACVWVSHMPFSKYTYVYICILTHTSSFFLVATDFLPFENPPLTKFRAKEEEPGRLGHEITNELYLTCTPPSRVWGSWDKVTGILAPGSNSSRNELRSMYSSNQRHVAQSVLLPENRSFKFFWTSLMKKSWLLNWERPRTPGNPWSRYAQGVGPEKKMKNTFCAWCTYSTVLQTPFRKKK